MKSKNAVYYYSLKYRIFFLVIAAVISLGVYQLGNEGSNNGSFLGFNVERAPLNMSELREEIKLNIDNLNEVNVESFEILSDELAKDNSNIFYIQSYTQNRGNMRYTLAPLSLNFNVEYDSLKPIFDVNHNNTSISTRFFKDNTEIYFLHEEVRYSHSNSIFEPLQNVSIETWSIVDNSKEFSFDENYIFFGSTILTNKSSQNTIYFGNSYLYHDSIIYFKNNPLIRKENVNTFEIVDDTFSYKILRIEDTIWIHPVYAARNIFLQNVSDASSFRYVGRHRQNQQLFDSLGIGMLHDLFEDSENYYSLRSSSVPMFGGAGTNYLEEMEIRQLFEIHPKE